MDLKISSIETLAISLCTLTIIHDVYILFIMSLEELLNYRWFPWHLLVAQGAVAHNKGPVLTSLLPAL